MSHVVVIQHAPSGLQFALRSREEWERLKALDVSQPWDIHMLAHMGFMVRHAGGKWIQNPSDGTVKGDEP